MPIAKTINGFLPACFLFKVPRASLSLSLSFSFSQFIQMHSKLYTAGSSSFASSQYLFRPPTNDDISMSCSSFLFVFLFVLLSSSFIPSVFIFRYGFLLYGIRILCIIYMHIISIAQSFSHSPSLSLSLWTLKKVHAK